MKKFRRLVVQREAGYADVPVPKIVREMASMADGMTTLLQDGIQKVLKGVCDFKQVRAVCIK